MKFNNTMEMVKSIVIKKTGNPDVLSVEDLPLKKPTGKKVLVKHEAIGLNFIDINFRRGSYPFKVPGILGCEAAGYIEAVGEEADDFKVGDRVAYATASSGAYSEKRIIDQRYLVPLPDYISFTDAAAMLLKGMTAHYLLRRTFFVSDKNTIMTYAAAGGVGQILCKLGQHYGATVIAVVGSKEKYNKAKALGTHIVINSEEEDVPTSVMSHSFNKGVHVVYDSIGKDTFETSLKCLSDFGIFVSFGAASGNIPPINVNKLKEKCLFFTATNLFVYKKTREELLLSSNEVFSLMKQKVIVPDIYKKYSFSEIKEAHTDIESRKTMGQCVLIP